MAAGDSSSGVPSAAGAASSAIGAPQVLQKREPDELAWPRSQRGRTSSPQTPQNAVPRRTECPFAQVATNPPIKPEVFQSVNARAVAAPRRYASRRCYSRREPQCVQNLSSVPSAAPQAAQEGTLAPPEPGPAGRSSPVAVRSLPPHFVQNCSPGIASCPHAGQVQAPCKKRTKRFRRSGTAGAVAPVAGAGCAAGAAPGGAAGAGAAGPPGRSDWSYRRRLSRPDSRSRLIARVTSRSCCERSGAVTASALACRLRRSTATAISSADAAGLSPRTEYQSDPGAGLVRVMESIAIRR